jgi:hypothetical protein
MNHDEEFMQLPEAVAMYAIHRERVVSIWDDALVLGKRAGMKEPAVTAMVLPILASLGFKMSRKSLFNLRRAYLSGGLMGIIDQRSLPRDRLRKFGPFFCELESMYTAELVRLEVCYIKCCQTAKYMQWAVPELRDCQRYMKKYILPSLTRERGNPRPSE